MVRGWHEIGLLGYPSTDWLLRRCGQYGCMLAHLPSFVQFLGCWMHGPHKTVFLVR